ncbi:MAG: autotransporter outer membrane beta-barrel domain-containing protein [Puniceicoccales bacterium]|nr:autotransporter outer membrane beta-barrel domain-containing protein [Puniceicoccales bacterium]
MGYRWENLRNFSAELYGKYFYSRLNGKKFSEEEISFRPLNFHRARLGCRLDYLPHWKLAPWCGAFYEREFSGGARGTAKGAKISQPSLKGGRTAGELGLSYRPIPAATVELALRGSAGTQKSIGGSLRARYEF